MPRVSNASKGVFIGFDACDPVLVQRWATEGKLPNFARLFAGGARAPIVHDPWYYVASLWPSFTTGRDPLSHGYVCWSEIETGTYVDTDVPVGPHLGTPFWETLSARGRRVAVIDVPHSWLPTEIDGVVVVDRCAHDVRGSARSFPASVSGELDDRVGPPVFTSGSRSVTGPCDRAYRAGALRTVDEQMTLHRELEAARRVATDGALSILERNDSELVCAVFADPHCVGHQFWHLHDGDHPRHDPVLRQQLGDPLFGSYHHADQTLGAVFDLVDADDTTIFVMLSHGMGPAYDGSALLEPVLARAAAEWRDERCPPVPEQVPVERASEPWFAVPGPQQLGGVRLNLAGREPAGLIAPGEEAEQAVATLDQCLRELVNVSTDESAVASIEWTDGRVPRRPDDRFPDIVVRWRTDAPLLRVASARLGEISTPTGHWRSGDHRERALLLVAGSGIVAGDRPPLRVSDITATVAASLGCPLPDVDGRARPELLGDRLGAVR